MLQTQALGGESWTSQDAVTALEDLLGPGRGFRPTADLDQGADQIADHMVQKGIAPERKHQKLTLTAKIKGHEIAHG